MKKLVAFLMALCLVCAAAAALAEAAPSFDDMPAAVVEDENTTIEEASFAGDWVVDKAFVSTIYVDLETLAAENGISIGKIHIGDGKMALTSAENGEEKTEELAYTFQAGQIQFQDAESGLNGCIDLLEDGNTCMSIFIPVSEEQTVEVSLFLVRAE